MATLLYQEHGSYRIAARDGTVIFVDPYAGAGYEAPADLVLITHQHSDHNQLSLVTQKEGCTVITPEEALAGGQYNTFSIDNAEVRAVPAYNQDHDRARCVGYVLTVDGVKIYAAGDTSATAGMKTLLAPMQLDWALPPIDGVFNMDAREAAPCAAILGAGHVIPIHMKPGSLFERRKAGAFKAPNRVIVEPGEEAAL